VVSPQGLAFAQSIRRCRDLVAVAAYLEQHPPLLSAADDVLRAALTQAVSALDRFVHERVRVAMLEAAQGIRRRTGAFERFPVPLAAALRGAGRNAADWLGPVVVEHHALLAFQRADKVADAIRPVHPDPLWPDLAARLGVTDPGGLRERLDLIIDRRNAVVHEDDSDGAAGRQPIDRTLVEDAISFIEAVVAAIDECVV
jgi:hypothetical protein